MKRLILDHFRRWWWVLAPAAVLDFILGRIIANRPQENFEFWGLMISLWTGANLLSYDVRRGIVRAVAVLPLTPRQIGRGWWLAMVPLPAIGLGALLFLGAGTFCYLHPAKAFPTERLAVASLFNLLWLGIISPGLTAATGSFQDNGRRLGAGCLGGLASVTLLAGMVLFQDASKVPAKFATFVGLGLLLTAAGWSRAQRFNPGGARRVGAAPRWQPGPAQPGVKLTPLKPKAVQVPVGYGGVGFLISTSFVRMFSYIAAMAALMALLRALQPYWSSQTTSIDQLSMTLAFVGGFMSCGFVIIFQLLPVLRQLRALRAMPFSATCLTAVALAIVILPLAALGGLEAGIAAVSLGARDAVVFVNSFMLASGLGALCVFFAVWLGESKLAYGLMITTLFSPSIIGLVSTFVLLRPVPLPTSGWTAPIVGAACIALAFLLTRHALVHSSRAYRLRANPIGNSPWGAGPYT